MGPNVKKRLLEIINFKGNKNKKGLKMNSSKKMMNVIKEASKIYIENMKEAIDGNEKTVQNLINQSMENDRIRITLDYIFVTSMGNLDLNALAYYQNIKVILAEQQKSLQSTIPLLQETGEIGKTESLELAMKLIENVTNTIKNLLEEN